MRLKSLALALSTAGLLAAVPAASASAATPADEPWPPGNCQPGTFCAWPNWAPPNTGPTETPSLVTTGPWVGSAPTKQFYNYTSANVELEYHNTWDPSTVITHCATPRGNIFYLEVIVTKVNWHGSC